MKLTKTFVSLLIAVAAGQALAGEVVVRSNRAPSAVALSSGFDSCAQALLARIFPGQSAEFRTKLNLDAQTKAAVWRDETFKMQARLKTDQFMLAEASCKVNTRDAQVLRMEIGMVSATKLAGLTPRDVQFAVVSR